jgi:hypothetical protein
MLYLNERRKGRIMETGFASAKWAKESRQKALEIKYMWISDLIKASAENGNGSVTISKAEIIKEEGNLVELRTFLEREDFRIEFSTMAGNMEISW